jgi:hypothetical protein
MNTIAHVDCEFDPIQPRFLQQTCYSDRHPDTLEDKVTIRSTSGPLDSLSKLIFLIFLLIFFDLFSRLSRGNRAAKCNSANFTLDLSNGNR